MAEYFDVIVIGAGQAGLAISYCLSAEGIDHVVLEKGAIANRWRAERWASLRLLTPNWMTRLPGYAYDGSDPDGFMQKDELVGFLGRYARSIKAPVREFTTVNAVTRDAGGFLVATDDATLRARAVVIATGACDRPNLPDWASHVAPGITQVTTENYNHAGDIEPGGVLVIGGSATGVQLAEELRHAGHRVTLASGSHVPHPRVYRGQDIMRWMDAAGILTEARDPSVPAARALSQPSLQLVGSVPPRNIGLDRLQSLGVRLVGRATGINGDRIALSGTLAAEIERGRARRDRLLSRIDDFIAGAALHAPHDVQPFPRTPVAADPLALNLRREGIKTIVWATGFRRDYSWLHIDALNSRGELKQTGGVCDTPGLYAMALPFMRRRNSTFIDGVGADARDLTHHICAGLGHLPSAAA
ncbi:MAG: NAD(P)/FAD-dependent oxidoreductase [Paracoccaceae bacterium]|nr:NAD(P)/FAD-dependent oxidoreductase [Paracoccaceae bacterium]